MLARERLGEWHAVAVPESVPKLRRALLAKIQGRGFHDLDVGLAVTEALSNVVRHAYPGGEGPVTLTAEASPSELVVVVADEGVGARSFELSSTSGLGIGLRLIHELCHHATHRADQRRHHRDHDLHRRKAGLAKRGFAS